MALLIRCMMSDTKEVPNFIISNYKIKWTILSSLRKPILIINFILEYFSSPISPAPDVPQGSFVSPLLFFLFIYDFVNVVSENARTFSDDLFPRCYCCVYSVYAETRFARRLPNFNWKVDAANTYYDGNTMQFIYQQVFREHSWTPATRNTDRPIYNLQSRPRRFARQMVPRSVWPGL